MTTSALDGSLRSLRADVIGSLVGPEQLRICHARFQLGTATPEELTAARDAAAREVIARQEAIGLPIVTDGEVRRLNFQESFGSAVSGFDVGQGGRVEYQLSAETRPFQRAEQDFDAAGPAIYSRRPVVERLKLVHNIPLEEYRLAAAVATRPVKMTVLSADRISQRFAWERSTSVYRDMDAFMADVVAINREIIGSLVAAGCRYIQVDAPGYTAYVDEVSLGRMRSRGEVPQRNLERSIAADNAMIAGFPGVTFGIHLCRGNARTIDPATGELLPQWHREGHYDAIAEQLFGELRYDRFLLEYDSERAGGFEPLRLIPSGKIAVLGLVTTKSTAVESVDELSRRIEEAGRCLPVEQLALSPQCGFGSIKHPRVPQDVQWRKLERIVETARRVWGTT